MDFDGCMMMNFRYLFIYKIEILFDKLVFLNIKCVFMGFFF
jgi:hypothetical protein